MNFRKRINSNPNLTLNDKMYREAIEILRKSYYRLTSEEEEFIKSLAKRLEL
jgi:hypothetical protein